MDGQLNPDQQQLVESMLVARPQFGDKLRDLTVVRDMVVGLNRDARIDVANDVMERIRRRARPRLPLANFRPWSSRTRKLAVSAGMFAAVAGLALVVNLRSLEHRPIAHAGPEIGELVDNRIPESRSDTTATADSLKSEAATVALVTPPVASAIKPDEAGERSTTQSAAAPSKGFVAERVRAGLQAELTVSRELLDNPNKRRFFLVKNWHDGNAEQRVASVVERTTRFNFCKITVAQGIVIDPRHPDQATVFAFLANPNEVDRVLDQLKSVMPDAIEEAPADPMILTQLADISQVQASPPLADVMIPREDLALRTRVVGSLETAAHSAPSPGSIEPATDQSHNDSVARSTPAGSPGQVDHGKAIVSAADVSRAVDASARDLGRSPQPFQATGVVSSERVKLAALSEREKSKDLVVVFVWVCQPKPS